jgi:pseudaminic acid synthase
MAELMKIGKHHIGADYPTYVIAEMSANHGQSFTQAVNLIHAAHAVGADAVKVQTYTPDTLTIDCDAPAFRVHGGLWDGRVLYELYREAYTPWEWQPALKGIAESLGMDFFSTPFDDTSVEFLEEMQVPAYKVASFELVDTALLRRIAKTGKPVILSTGMASLGEIAEAVAVLRESGSGEIALLKCTSAYPAPPQEMNLRTIPHLAATFGLPVGLSDHTLGFVAAVTAVAMGALVIEKHLTLSRSAPGPDSAFSLEPHEFRQMVDAIRETELLLGRPSYDVTEREASSRVFRRSLFVVQNVRKGERFTPENVRSIRPGYGLPPKYLNDVIGRKASEDIGRGTPLTWNHTEL